jgi:hypothetical protein
MANELQLRVGFARLMQAAVLRPVENQNLSIDGERGDDVWVLRLVSCFVDLARVIDLLGDFEGDDRRLAAARPATIAAKLTTLLVKIRGIGFDRLWDLEFRDLNVIGFSFGRVRSNQQPVDCLVLILQVLHVGEPLGRQSWPLESRALDS